jgi:hypothetical protein
MARRYFRFSFLKFLCTFGLFWILFLLYLSTWNPNFLNVVNQKFDIDVQQMIRRDFVKIIEKDLMKDKEKNEIFEGIEGQDRKEVEKSEKEVEYFEEQKTTIPKPMLSDDILALHARLNLTNPGHMGSGVHLPENLDFDIQEMLNNSWKTYKINEFISSLVPLDRELPDFRNEYCKQQNYSQNLPMASMILVFHNEALSMILRTVYSILNRSPEELIREIILVDDCSSLSESFMNYYSKS